MKLPERNVILGVVVADGQPVTVGLYIEEDSRAAVGVAGDGFELHVDCAIGEVAHRLEDCYWVIGELPGVVHQLFIRSSVELAGALNQQFGGIILARDPGTTIHHDDLIRAVLRHHPCANHRLKCDRRLTDVFFAEIDLLLSRVKGYSKQRED